MKPDLDALRDAGEAGEKEEVSRGKKGGLGTFGGVFTPSVLTILGVIMYLRFGWIVGNAGLLGTLLIVTISTGITFLTALSIAAIATDQRVRVGGAYYMISRSLGIEIGGAVGIPLYIALALSVALYTVGFAESLLNVFPVLEQLQVLWFSGIQVVGLVVTVGVAMLAMASPNIAIRAQYVILAAIALSLVSLVAGGPVEQSDIRMWGAVDAKSAASFWEVFSVFFPAVTGIMAGVNLSGDLEDPNRSIPWGTFSAVGVGYVVYMGLPVLLGMWADSATLIEDKLIMRRMAWWGDAILLGVWGATLSSAIGSILGGPRVLQALALDGALPSSLKWLGHGAGEENIPRWGTVLTLGIALGGVMSGNLNAIAPVLTMFFLTTYAVLNVAAGVEGLLNSPSFRPEFSVHWSLSLLGAAGCTVVMFLINWWASIISILFVLGVFLYLEQSTLRTAWGDVRQGIWKSVIRTGLMNLDHEEDPKNWRPHILVLTGAPRERWPLIDEANSFTHDRALMTVATILSTDQVNGTVDQREVEQTLQDYLQQRSVQCLTRMTTADNPFEGAKQLVDNYGMGPLEPNTVMLGDPDPEHREEFCSLVQHIYNARRNVVVLRVGDGDFGERERIDVWWSGLQGNGGLMKIMAYLLQTSSDWRGADVRLLVVAKDEEEARQREDNLGPIVQNLKTGAQLEVITTDGRSFEQILHDTSSNSDAVFLGMSAPEEQADYADYYATLQERTANLPPTFFVLAAEDVSFREVLT
jgi:amino acid transporter